MGDVHRRIGQRIHKTPLRRQAERGEDRRLGEIGIDQQHLMILFHRQRHCEVDRAKRLALVRVGRRNKDAPR